MPGRYFLAFDGRKGRGTREHFFHFMLGYLLPAAHSILERRGGREDEFVFVSCGPTMDAKTAEMASLLGVRHTIVPYGQTLPGRTTTVSVPRWDSFVCSRATYSALPVRSAAARVLRETAKQRSIPPVLWRKRSIVAGIHRVREAVLARIAAGNGAASSYYILRRSEEPAFYAADGGGAELRTYGTSRRALLGIEDAAVRMSGNSRHVSVFEPGAHTLAEQIRTFHGCAGIIAIRGAELANMVWMRPGSVAIVINAGEFLLSVPPPRTLARLLGVRYVEIDWGDHPFPTLDGELGRRVADLLHANAVS